MKWVDRLLRRRRGQTPMQRSPEDDQDFVTGELRMAQEGRQEAERKLEQTRRVGQEVARVSEVARRIRTQNNFSARWDAALRKPKAE